MLLPFSPDIKVQQARREQMAIMSFLAGLPLEFDVMTIIKSHILSSSKISSLFNTFGQILQTESSSSIHMSSAFVSRNIG